MTQEIFGNVVLGFGQQDMDWFGKAAKVCGKKAIPCPDTARMAGANLAAGTPEALAALRQRLTAGALQAQQEATPGLSMAAAQWLASGERGLSSEFMFQHLTGIQTLRDHWADEPRHPSDPADLRRCRLLLEQVPELQAKLPLMAKASRPWAALIASWEQICATMDEETPQWRVPRCGQRASKTYDLIKQATEN